jgi:hypothetical protein
MQRKVFGLIASAGGAFEDLAAEDQGWSGCSRGE